MIADFKKIKTFLFDLDGTVWNWNELYPNVKNVINKLEKDGKKIYFVSNNSVLSRAGHAKKLTLMGIPTNENQVITSGYSAALYFRNNGISSVYVIGEKGLVTELTKQGITTSDNAKHMVISLDRNFTYWKLKTAYEIIKKGGEVYCCGHGRMWIVGNEMYPGEDPIVRAVEDFTGKTATLLGKPSDYMKKALLHEVHLFPEDTLFIGDSLLSDMTFGHKCGFKTALVLYGRTTLKQANSVRGEEKPDFLIQDIRELLM